MRSALLIGNSQYDDPALARLGTPAADTRSLAEVLRDPHTGGFDEVTPLLNQKEGAVRRAISTFLNNKKLDDLVLLYFSGHGVLDENGILFLAAQDTHQRMLNATGIPAQSFLIYEIDRCRSRSKILILDCCYAGAFSRGARGVKGAEPSVTRATFESAGTGLVVMTASSSTQFASEGEQGSAAESFENPSLSVFTHYLVEGLKTGNADLDNDGKISLDELYAYTHNQVVQQLVKQTPCKYVYNQQGELVIARSTRTKTAQAVRAPGGASPGSSQFSARHPRCRGRGISAPDVQRQCKHRLGSPAGDGRAHARRQPECFPEGGRACAQVPVPIARFVHWWTSSSAEAAPHHLYTSPKRHPPGPARQPVPLNALNPRLHPPPAVPQHPLRWIKPPGLHRK